MHSRLEKRAAEILSEYVTWRGRYVLPREASIDELIPVEGDDGLVGSKQNLITIEQARHLIDRVVTGVKQELYGQ